MEEKREYPRLKCIFKVRFPEEKELEAENFSLGGMFVKTAFSQRFNMDDTVYLIVYLPTDTKRPLTAQSKVVNVLENGIGVKFLNLNEGTKQGLQECYNLVYGHDTQMQHE
jgi:hypothetical protein